jgi:hypothetical protein
MSVLMPKKHGEDEDEDKDEDKDEDEDLSGDLRILLATDRLFFCPRMT